MVTVPHNFYPGSYQARLCTPFLRVRGQFAQIYPQFMQPGHLARVPFKYVFLFWICRLALLMKQAAVQQNLARCCLLACGSSVVLGLCRPPFWPVPPNDVLSCCFVIQIIETASCYSNPDARMHEIMDRCPSLPQRKCRQKDQPGSVNWRPAESIKPVPHTQSWASKWLPTVSKLAEVGGGFSLKQATVHSALLHRAHVLLNVFMHQQQQTRKYVEDTFRKGRSTANAKHVATTAAPSMTAPYTEPKQPAPRKPLRNNCLCATI